MDASTVSKNSEGIYTGLVHPDCNVYSTVGQTSYNSPGAQRTVPKSRERSGLSSLPYKLATLCLGLLCALLLIVILALCFYSSCLSRRYSEKEDFRVKYTKLMETHNEKKKAYNDILQKLGFLGKYCPLFSQDSVCNPCPHGWQQFNSKCYYFCTNVTDWRDSRIDCLIRGADLMIIDSEDEQEFISNHTKEDEYWIGLSDSETEKTWLWVNGTTLQNGFWRSGEPDDYYTDGYGTLYPQADCAVTVPGESTWADSPCHFYKKHICETEALLPALITALFI